MLSINAKFLQEIELKNGAVVMGYVYKQIPGKSMLLHVTKTLKDPTHKFYPFDKNYQVAWDEVKTISRSEDSDEPWCYDRITTSSKKVYTGTIIKQVPGVSTVIKTKDGEVVTVKNSELIQSEKVSKDIDHDLWVDRQYTNRLRLNDNSLHDGLIVLQYRGRKLEDCYLDLLHSSGSTERIYLMDIKEYIFIIKQ